MNASDTIPEKLTNVQGLIDALFADGAKPSVRHIRRLQAKGAIPFYRFGGKILFSPPAVRSALDRQATAIRGLRALEGGAS